MSSPEVSLSDGIQVPPRRSLLRRLARRSLQGIGILVLLVGIFLGVEQLLGNFHTVIAGEFYRSAQIDAKELDALQKNYGIKTVINLRGESSKSWYNDEIAESARLGIQHIDYGLSASHELTQKQVEELIALMRDAPKPILVHCRGGADRTGIASALYLAAIAKQSERAAEWQLSLFYGHFPIPFFPAWAMDETFERVEPWLGYHDS